nr:MAG TPA: hypothetical protein [Caudoviricetes sp.]
MYLWQLCGNLWQREEKCGKGCGNVAILLYICVNKKRLIILIIKHLTFLPQLPQMNCPKMGSLIFNCNFSPKTRIFSAIQITFPINIGISRLFFLTLRCF